MLQSETNTDRERGGDKLQVFIAQIASSLGIWNGEGEGVSWNSLPLFEAKVASSSYQDVLQTPLIEIQKCL